MILKRGCCIRKWVSIMANFVVEFPSKTEKYQEHI